MCQAALRKENASSKPSDFTSQTAPQRGNVWSQPSDVTHLPRVQQHVPEQVVDPRGARAVREVLCNHRSAPVDAVVPVEDALGKDGVLLLLSEQPDDFVRPPDAQGVLAQLQGLGPHVALPNRVNSG